MQVEVGRDGESRGRLIEWSGEMPLVIGRSREADVPIQDPLLSRRQCRLELVGGKVYVVDLGSSNGSFVNDMPVTHARLHDGDYLRVGNCIYRFIAGGNVESEYHEEIYRLTIIDGLTSVHNQRYMTEFLDRELARSARHRRPLAVILCDIDLFKKINDEYGHLGGDFTLRELASVIQKTVRREDLFHDPPMLAPGTAEPGAPRRDPPHHSILTLEFDQHPVPRRQQRRALLLQALIYAAKPFFLLEFDECPLLCVRDNRAVRFEMLRQRVLFATALGQLHRRAAVFHTVVGKRILPLLLPKQYVRFL